MSDVEDVLTWYVEMWRKPGFRRYAEEAVKTLTKDHPQAFGTLQRRFDEATLEIRNAHAAKQNSAQFAQRGAASDSAATEEKR